MRGPGPVFHARAVPPPPLPHQVDLLERVLQTVSEWEGERPPVVVFDLDATLFDNRPRTLEIIHEFVREVEEDDPELANKLLTLELGKVEYLLSDTLTESASVFTDTIELHVPSLEILASGSSAHALPE